MQEYIKSLENSIQLLSSKLQNSIKKFKRERKAKKDLEEKANFLENE